MMRLVFQVMCTACLFLTACNNGAKTDNEAGIPAEEKQLRAQIAQYPDSLALRNKLVDYFAVNSDYGNALKETDLILQRDSNNAGIWDARARLNFLNNDTTGAIKALQKAIGINPDPQYIISLATLYAQQHNPMAIGMGDALIRSPRSNTALQGMFIKGLYYNYAGDKAIAISLFDKCLSMDYTFLDAYREKGIALYDMGKYSDALQLMQKATAVQRTFDEGYYWMGRCCEKLNKKKEAIENYQLALQIDTGFVEAKEALEKLQ